MSQTRVSPEGLEQRKQELARLKEEIREHEKVLQDKESAVWQRISPRIKKAIEANREKIEAILASGPTRLNEEGHVVPVDPMADFASLKTLGGAIAFGKHILAEVEVEPIIARKRERVQQLSEQITKISEEQGF